MQAPRTWGWTAAREEAARLSKAGPTHVGMDRGLRPADTDERRRPHARGDGPRSLAAEVGPRGQAPRTWGWTAEALGIEVGSAAGPTHVGMDRRCRTRGCRCTGRPHARGDGPGRVRSRRNPARQAPRTWGWTTNRPALNTMPLAGPTHVGMDRPGCYPGLVQKRRPHARGDGPSTTAPSPGTGSQAPRTWGWTVNEDPELNHMYAGPTHVGMDRQRGPRVEPHVRRPHARGDGPSAPGTRSGTCAQAPRTWGWTAEHPTRLR